MYSKTPQGDHPSTAGTPLRRADFVGTEYGKWVLLNLSNAGIPFRRPLGIGTMSGRLSGVLLYMNISYFLE